MNLKDIYKKNTKKPIISYEIFPPKDDINNQKLENLFFELKILKKYNPALISVTYGAGGSNRNKSIEIIKRIKNETSITPMPHFTCVSTDKANIKSYLNEIESLGIKNILALRGDMPTTGEVFNDFKHASELVEFIKSESSLSVAVAGYPEGHAEAESIQKDLEYLKNKVDKGADAIYTQLFFNNECFFNFVEKCTAMNINVPIIPGIMPIISYKSIQKMISLCNIDVPQKLADVIDKYKDNNDYIQQYGIEYSTKQCQELIENGIGGLHFYTLNKSDSTSQILENLNIG